MILAVGWRLQFNGRQSATGKTKWTDADLNSLKCYSSKSNSCQTNQRTIY